MNRSVKVIYIKILKQEHKARVKHIDYDTNSYRIFLEDFKGTNPLARYIRRGEPHTLHPST